MAGSKYVQSAWFSHCGVFVGLQVGVSVGLADGLNVGARVGSTVGDGVGRRVGDAVGIRVGLSVGLGVGILVGGSVVVVEVPVVEVSVIEVSVIEVPVVEVVVVIKPHSSRQYPLLVVVAVVVAVVEKIANGLTTRDAGSSGCPATVLPPKINLIPVRQPSNPEELGVARSSGRPARKKAQSAPTVWQSASSRRFPGSPTGSRRALSMVSTADAAPIRTRTR